jgi:hypothetical protein
MSTVLITVHSLHKNRHLKSTVDNSAIPASFGGAIDGRPVCSGMAATGKEVTDKARAKILRTDRNFMFAMITLTSKRNDRLS